MDLMKNGKTLMQVASEEMLSLEPEGRGQSIYRRREKEGNHLTSDVETYKCSLF
jgi:hypothetical protein